MNIRDTQWLSSILESNGFSHQSLDNAQIIILNTCSVRGKPEQKVKNAIRSIYSITGNNPDILVCVVGCVAQQMGLELTELSPQVRLIAGPDGLLFVPDSIEQLLNNPDLRLTHLNFSRLYSEREVDRQDQPNPSSFVSIMQGCDNFCTYCIVPFTRGRQKSRSFQAILEECEQRIDEGSKEIVLLGQNVNAWWDKDRNFSWLLHRIASLSGLARLRFLTSHPKDMDQPVIEAFKELPVLCPSLHLPLQAGSDSILSSMHRKYTRKEYLDLVLELKRARPDIALTTDIITGFPGETEEDFQQTLSAMEECQFTSSFSFCYNDRPGTKASKMPNKIPVDIQLDRLARVQELQDKMSTNWLNSRKGTTIDILVEGKSSRGDTWQGRDPYGNVINVAIPDENPRGNIYSVLVTTVKRHSLVGEIVKP